jgi:dTDP-4-amino-4,6-dideoxygalactose transaminase
MLTTADPALDQCFRLWRQHSMDIPDTVRHGTNTVIFESYRDLGYNYRLTDIQAAVGREQLKRLPEIITRRRRQVARYRVLLADIPGLILPIEPDWARSNWQSFCVRLPEERDQARVMQHMLDAGIATRRGIMCAHREPAYAVEPWTCGADDCSSTSAPGHCTCLYESEQAQDHTILLPLFHEMSDEQQDSVAAALREACAS